MSHSSNTTLISPTATMAHPSAAGAMGPPTSTRRTSHGAHHQVHHHVKRRQGSSTHHHAHVAHHTSAGTQSSAHAGPSRRSSEGEHGRRAVAAGLTMASMEPGKPKRKGSGDRPFKKPSKSDTNLPRLSRVNSHASQRSNRSRSSSRQNSRANSRANSPARPDAQARKRSDTSVQLDAQGNPEGEVDSAEEGWEDESKKDRSHGRTPRAATRPGVDDGKEGRRKSDTHVQLRKSRSGVNLDTHAHTHEESRPPNTTRKTTGFAGPTQTPDPAVATPTHAQNDPLHIMPAHQIKHQQSARSLHAQQAQQAQLQQQQQQQAADTASDMGLGKRGDASRRSLTGLRRTESDMSSGNRQRTGSTEMPPAMPDVKRVESGLSMTKTAGETPPNARRQPAGPGHETPTAPNDPSDIRVGAEPAGEAHTSPSYPFPRPLHEQHQDEPTVSDAPLSESPSTIMAPPPQQQPHPQPRRQQAEEYQPRSRQISTASTNTIANGPTGTSRTLRHRYSNSSIRSIQSLRAPPHPLNSPTGYRTGMHGGGSGSTHPSPMKGKGPSMHHPPIAPPVINREMAEGMQWASSGVPEDSPTSSSPTRSVRRDAGGSQRADRAPTIGRTSSFSSVRSFTNLLGGSTNSAAPSTSSSTTQRNSNTANAQSRPGANRRPTALEAASKASRLRSTADPAAYHASLGYPSSTADTAHLISRFLPPPKVPRPAWEISPDAARAGYVGIGLTNGDYRESHEALVRTMRDLGTGALGDGNKSVFGRQSSGGTSRLAFGLNVNGDPAAQRNASMTTTLGSGALTPRQSAHGLSISSIDEMNATTSAPTNYGIIKGQRGGLVVQKGGWGGRTPFLLSVDRCLAQRPRRSITGI